MNSVKPYQHIIDNLKNEEDLERIVKEEEECFYLDYKESSGDYTKSHKLVGSDWKNLAKGISGFGNSLGGLLIFGIEDKTKKLKPIKGIKNFEMIVNEFIPRSTNPSHESVNTHIVSSKNNADSGYLIVEIPKSLYRPLQVITNEYNHQYFYRSGESHQNIPHDVLVAMLGYKIPPKLGYQVRIDDTKDFDFEIIIRNQSSVIARDIWFNINIGIPNVGVYGSADPNCLFTGYRLGNSMSIITKEGFRLPPQGYIPICKIQIPKSELVGGQQYSFYFTFGCEGSSISEFNSKFSGEDFNSIDRGDVNNIIKFIQKNSPNHITEKI